MEQQEFDLRGRRVFVAGHQGMVGSAIVRRLGREGCTLLTASRATLDLRDQLAVNSWFEVERPEVIFLAAAKVGGILANESHPATFLTDNLLIAVNAIEAARRIGVAKLLYIASSAVYPRMGDEIISEDALFSGPPEPTHEGYAVAKIAGIKMTQLYRREHGCNFIAAVPSNLYGKGDKYDPAASHVIPALLRKVYEAKRDGAATVTLWGTGEARREFLHCDDMADACVFLMRHYNGSDPVNIGSGCDISISELLDLVKAIAGYKGVTEHDLSKPNGAMRRLMSSAQLNALGWHPKISLPAGLADAYRSFLAHHGIEM